MEKNAFSQSSLMDITLKSQFPLGISARNGERSRPNVSTPEPFGGLQASPLGKCSGWPV